MKAITKYFREVKSELNKVVWPKAGEVIKLTIIVLLVSAIVSLYVGGLDIGFTKLLELVVSH